MDDDKKFNMIRIAIAMYNMGVSEDHMIEYFKDAWKVKLSWLEPESEMFYEKFEVMELNNE